MKIFKTFKQALLAFAIVGCCAVGVTVEAASPVETYKEWDPALQEYTKTICSEYNVDYPLALAVIYNESRFQSGLTHLNSNGTTDYGLMQVNEVNYLFLHKNLGINSMSELLQDEVGIKCGVYLLSYHKQYTNDDSKALLRYQIGEGAYRKYMRSGRHTNPTHTKVWEYRNEFDAYRQMIQERELISAEKRLQTIIHRWATTFIKPV